MFTEKTNKLLEEIVRQTDPENDRVVLTDEHYILVIRRDKKRRCYESYDILEDIDYFQIDYRISDQKPEYFTELTTTADKHLEIETINDVLKIIFN